LPDQRSRDHLQSEERRHFENTIWPHLTAAYNFARWMVKNHHDAEEVVQESFLKAFRAAASFRGTDPRPWLLAIVRNSALTFLSRSNRPDAGSPEAAPEPADSAPGPEESLLERQRREHVRAAIAALPQDFREAILLREMEGMSYKEIAYVLKVPLGTVMSRISRARNLLVESLIDRKECKQ
jgi:RNA polymerase sigma-70 factor, ECF subfamily